MHPNNHSRLVRQRHYYVRRSRKKSAARSVGRNFPQRSLPRRYRFWAEMGLPLFITAEKASFCAQIMTNFCSIQIEFQFKGEWRVLHFFRPIDFYELVLRQQPINAAARATERAPLFPSAACAFE